MDSMTNNYAAIEILGDQYQGQGLPNTIYVLLLSGVQIQSDERIR